MLHCLKTRYFLFNLNKFIIRQHSLFQKIAKTSYNMDKAYFRHITGEEQYNLSFLYRNEELRIQREFNFSRQSTENVASLVNRIITNVDKVISKKNKKRKHSKNEEEGETSHQIRVRLLQNGEEVNSDSICVDILKSDENIELHVDENVYNIKVNSPWITNINLPVSILAGFPVYPIKFEGLFMTKDKCQFSWYIGDNNQNVKSISWQKVGSGFIYMTSVNDIGKRIRLLCLSGNDDGVGNEVECISSNAVQAGPGICPFETRHKFTTEKLRERSIRIVSYNLLADLYCDSDFSHQTLFPYCPPYALHIDYRKQLFLKEILGYNADIVCLQEVDSKIFNGDLEPLLNVESYTGCFSKKGGQVVEGLACFFRNDRFKLLEGRSCILGEELNSPVFKDVWDQISNNKPFLERIEPRTTVVQGTILQSLENENEIIIVGNTHFYFHPDADHVRVIQGGLTILWLSDIVNQYKATMPDKRISLLLCGDFNSVPSCGVYQLYTTGCVSEDLEDFKSNENEALSGVTLRQPLPLASACGTPEFTNYTVGFADCLDYIFYNTECFDVEQVVPFPSSEELQQNIAIPSIVFPSDHIALIADLKFK